MVVGSWGSITFEVSDSRVRTYDEFTRTTESRWGSHEVFKTKPRAQYGGQGQDEISVTIRLSADMGVDPRDEVAKIRKAVDSGVHAPFIRNGVPESQNDWYIESAEETDTQLGKQGKTMFAEMALVFKEYF